MLASYKVNVKHSYQHTHTKRHPARMISQSFSLFWSFWYFSAVFPGCAIYDTFLQFSSFFCWSFEHFSVASKNVLSRSSLRATLDKREEGPSLISASLEPTAQSWRLWGLSRGWSIVLQMLNSKWNKTIFPFQSGCGCTFLNNSMLGQTKQLGLITSSDRTRHNRTHKS